MRTPTDNLIEAAESVLDQVESEGRDTGMGDAFSDLRDAVQAAKGGDDAVERRLDLHAIHLKGLHSRYRSLRDAIRD